MHAACRGFNAAHDAQLFGEPWDLLTDHHTT